MLPQLKTANPVKTHAISALKSIAITLCLALGGCVSLPTLVQVARERQCGTNAPELSREVASGTASPGVMYTGTSDVSSNARWAHRNDLAVAYTITDLDVLNWTDRVKIIIAKHCDEATIVRYSSSAGQDTLSALAGAASAAGWATSTASGFGLGATFISVLGKTFDAKGDSGAYDQAFTDIQEAENLYYFYSLGMKFGSDKKVDPTSYAQAKAGIPSPVYLTAQGETLQHRVVAIVKVLNAALEKKIPDLQDLKDAKGDSSSTNIAKPEATNPSSALPSSTSRSTHTGRSSQTAASTATTGQTPAQGQSVSQGPGPTQLPGATGVIGGGGGAPVTISPIPANPTPTATPSPHQ